MQIEIICRLVEFKPAFKFIQCNSGPLHTGLSFALCTFHNRVLPILSSPAPNICYNTYHTRRIGSIIGWKPLNDVLQWKMCKCHGKQVLYTLRDMRDTPSYFALPAASSFTIPLVSTLRYLLSHTVEVSSHCGPFPAVALHSGPHGDDLASSALLWSIFPKSSASRSSGGL